MIIRKADKNDLNQIVSLLKASLGEELIPKTAAFWNWKHRNNPFGESPVLVAEQDHEIIGVRAFLNWEYIQNGQLIQAQRAVDTAVHPDFQGKGIFSKLTLQLLKESEFQGTQLIFNTPNKKSAPGYLKLGWKKWAKLPVRFKPVFFAGNQPAPAQDYSWESASEFIDQLEIQKTESSEIQTHLIKGYLHWRYRDCPMVSYQLISDFSSYLLIYRLKESKWGKELRICDLFTSGKPDTKSLSSAWQTMEQKEKPRFVTFSGLQSADFLPKIWKLIPSRPIGPIITLKPLNPELDALKLPWAWSLGDLEVF